MYLESSPTKVGRLSTGTEEKFTMHRVMMHRVILSSTTTVAILFTTLNLYAAELMAAVESAAGVCDKSVTSASLVKMR